MLFETFADNSTQKNVDLKLEVLVGLTKKDDFKPLLFSKAFEKSLLYLYYSYIDYPLFFKNFVELIYKIKKDLFSFKINLFGNFERIFDHDEKKEYHFFTRKLISSLSTYFLKKGNY